VVFSWSYRHLPEDAAKMFRLLGLHPAQDWDQYAAAALTATGNLSQARQLLSVLAQAHLIQPARAGRYQMHDLLRAYAAELAAAHDNQDSRQEALTCLFDFYLAASLVAMDCLAPAERHRRPAPPPVSSPVPELDSLTTAQAWLKAELATLTAIAAYTASSGWPGHTTRLASTLYRYLNGGYYTEGITVHTHALNAARGCGDSAGQGHTLASLAGFHHRQGRHRQAADCCQQAIALARKTGDQFLEARALGNLALVHERRGRYQQALGCHQQALAIHRDLGTQSGEAITKCNLGYLYVRVGRYQQAARLQRQALALSRKIDLRVLVAYALTSLGEICSRQGSYQQAASYLGQALTEAREIGDRSGEADALTRLGAVCFQQGDRGQAAEHYQQALAIYRETGERDGETEALNGIGEALLATGQLSQAHACHTAALALTRQTGDPYQQARSHQCLASATYAMGQTSQARQHWQHALDIYTDLAVPEAAEMRASPIAAEQAPAGTP
jgi:tetratricopeptide (TPR) repeat protein